VAVGLSLIASAPARAADSWIIEDLRGTVVRLEGDHWQEVLKGERIGASTVLQSLASSRAIVRTSSLRMRLGSETTVEATVGVRLISVNQYSGTIEVVLANDSALELAVRTPGLVVSSSSGGRLSVEVKGGVTEIAVLSGTAQATDTASGRVLVLQDGDSTSDLRAEIIEASANGTQVAGADGAVTPVPGTPPVSALTVNSAAAPSSPEGGTGSATTPGAAGAGSTNAAAGGESSSGAGGNPNSNAGGNPNSNAGGNPNSNAGGNPNSNAGGNPNSNAGGNPNSNAGGNPNSNAGGNPNSNAGGNPNSNAGGNPNSNAGGKSNTDGNAATGGGESSGSGGGKSKNSGKGS